MATNFIQVPPNSTGLKLDANELVVNSNTVERQNICFADPVGAGLITNVVAGTNPAANYLLTSVGAGRLATYAASFTNVSASTSATADFFTLFGNVATPVRVLQIGISGTATTAAAYFDIVLKTASAAPTGGTATTIPIVPFDSLDPAASAIAKVYTVPPTAATYVGTVASAKLFAPITGTPALLPPTTIFNFGAPTIGRSVVLRSAAEGLSLTLNAVAPANATSFDGWIIWAEGV